MKILTIFAFVLSLPGNGINEIITEKAESMLSSAITAGFHSKINLARQDIHHGGIGHGGVTVKGSLKNVLKKQGEIVYSIPITESISVPFTRQEYEEWSRNVNRIIKGDKYVQLVSPKTHIDRQDLDGKIFAGYLNDLAAYVKERKLDILGRVRDSTDKKARLAILELIAIQHHKNLIFYPNHWEIPAFARNRLKEILEREDIKVAAKQVFRPQVLE